jgi:hypothetical protein
MANLQETSGLSRRPPPNGTCSCRRSAMALSARGRRTRVGWISL